MSNQVMIDCTAKGKRLAGYYLSPGDLQTREIIGLVISDNPYRRGACVKLPNGNLVELNYGCIRTLPMNLSYIV